MGISRKIMIETRNRIDNREQLDHQIYENFFSVFPADVKRCFIYASSNREADTREIIEELLKRGVQVFCPKVVEMDMYFFEIHSLSDLVPGYHRILEPDVEEFDRDIREIIEEKAVSPEWSPEDLCVVPGVIFDEDGNRMGYGFGFYDRFLNKHLCKKTALAYEVQIQPQFMEDLSDSDIPMDTLITNEKVRSWERDYTERLEEMNLAD